MRRVRVEATPAGGYRRPRISVAFPYNNNNNNIYDACNREIKPRVHDHITDGTTMKSWRTICLEIVRLNVRLIT